MIHRDAEHYHDPHAVTRIQESALGKEKRARNLRFALSSFTADELPAVLAEALTATHKSKGKAFNVLEAALNEVVK